MSTCIESTTCTVCDPENYNIAYMCDYCAEEAGGIRCTICERWDYPDDMDDGYCLECWDESFIRCSYCDEKFSHDDNTKRGRCPECYRTPFEGLVTPLGPKGHTWDEWENLNDIAATVDFGCSFDSNGCAAQRSQQDLEWGCSSWEGSTEQGCCRECVEQVGYLDHLPADGVAAAKAAWNYDTGFWSSAGCMLPSKYRSAICVRYRCHASGKGSDDYKALVQLTCWV